MQTDAGLLQCMQFCPENGREKLFLEAGAVLAVTVRYHCIAALADLLNPFLDDGMPTWLCTPEVLPWPVHLGHYLLLNMLLSLTVLVG